MAKSFKDKVPASIGFSFSDDVIDLMEDLQKGVGSESTEDTQETPGAVQTEQGAVQKDAIFTKKEKRSERLQLLLTPTLLRQLKETAEENGVSVNEAVNTILQAHFKN